MCEPAQSGLYSVAVLTCKMVSFVRPPIPSDFCEGEVAALRAAEPRLPRPGRNEREGGGRGGGQV